MEKVLVAAGTLRDFLSSKQRQDEYFAAAQEHYGADHFPRQSFDAVLGQFEETLKRVPELAERAWSPTPNPGSIVLVRADFQVDFNGSNWMDRLNAYLPTRASLGRSGFRALLQSLERKAERASDSVKAGRKGRAERASRYEEIKSSFSFKQAIDQTLWLALGASVRSGEVRSADPDTALVAWQWMKESLTELVPDLREFPEIARMIADRLPSAEALSKDEKFFLPIKKRNCSAV